MTNSRWCFPAEPFRVRLAEYLGRYEKSWVHTDARGMEETAAPRPEWCQLSPRDQLAIHMGMSRAWVDKFLAGYFATIHFDVADRLMCAMNIAHEWWTNPDFRPLYESVDLVGLDKAKPTTRRRHFGGRHAPWPQEQAVLLFQRGVSYADIAKRLSSDEFEVTPRHVRELISRRGLLKPLEPTYDRAEAIRLHDEEGLTWREVGERMGVNVETLRSTASLVRRGKRRLAA